MRGSQTLFSSHRIVVARLSREAFIDDERTIYAVLHALLLIGEAANHLTESFRAAYAALPWTRITGLRNHLVHASFAIDGSLIWEITQSDSPELLRVPSPLVSLD